MIYTEEQISFTNWSTELFEATWGGSKKVINPGESIIVSKGVADVFAYHLAVREIQKEKGDVSITSFINEYKQKAFQLVETVKETPEEEEAPTPKTKRGRKAKVNVVEEKEEDEFEGLE